MTRSGLTSRDGYTGTGATDTYSYTFPIDDEDDLLVTETLIATGVETTLTITTDYTVTGVGATAGGTIVLVAGNFPATKTLTIRRVVPLTQLTDLRNQGTYFPEDQEKALDKKNDQIQQMDDEIGRSFKLGESVDPANFSTIMTPVTAGYVPAINATEDGIEMVPVDAAAISAAVTAAELAETNAETAETNAAASESAAAASESNAATSETNAAASAATASGAVAVLADGDPLVEWDTASASTLTLIAGSHVPDTTGLHSMTIATNQTVDITVSGENGLEAGDTESSSTWYALLIIWDAAETKTVKGLLVDIANYPSSFTLPTGYDIYKRVGAIYNDGSSDFRFESYYNGFQNKDGSQTLLSAGTATTQTTITPSAALKHPYSRKYSIGIDANASASGSLSVDLFRTDSASASPQVRAVQGIIASDVMSMEMGFPVNSSGQFDYQNTNGAGTGSTSIRIFGYYDDLTETP